MTQKDFVLIAAVIRRMPTPSPLHREIQAKLATTMAHDLDAINPRFDRARFLKACGVAE